MDDQQGGTFTVNTQNNPREHCNTITTRNGRMIKTRVGENAEKERVMVARREKQEGENEKELEKKKIEDKVVESEKNLSDK